MTELFCASSCACYQVAALFANLLPLSGGDGGMCSAHFWARKLSAQGHVVKLMAPQFVKPYIKGSKTDTACEAVPRPLCALYQLNKPSSSHYWPLAVHWACTGFVKARIPLKPASCEACWLNSE